MGGGGSSLAPGHCHSRLRILLRPWGRDPTLGLLSPAHSRPPSGTESEGVGWGGGMGQEESLAQVDPLHSSGAETAHPLCSPFMRVTEQLLA